jgi:hypothetical protein
MSQTLTPEELKEFQDVRADIYKSISTLGDLTYQKTLIELELEKLKDYIAQNAIKEKALLTGFGQKYGDGSINTETGEITPI